MPRRGRDFDESEHPRWPEGTPVRPDGGGPGGGRFRDRLGGIMDAAGGLLQGASNAPGTWAQRLSDQVGGRRGAPRERYNASVMQRAGEAARENQADGTEDPELVRLIGQVVQNAAHQDYRTDEAVDAVREHLEQHYPEMHGAGLPEAPPRRGGPQPAGDGESAQSLLDRARQIQRSIAANPDEPEDRLLNRNIEELANARGARVPAARQQLRDYLASEYPQGEPPVRDSVVRVNPSGSDVLSDVVEQGRRGQHSLPGTLSNTDHNNLIYATALALVDNIGESDMLEEDNQPLARAVETYEEAARNPGDMLSIDVAADELRDLLYDYDIEIPPRGSGPVYPGTPEPDPDRISGTGGMMYSRYLAAERRIWLYDPDVDTWRRVTRMEDRGNSLYIYLDDGGEFSTTADEPWIWRESSFGGLAERVVAGSLDPEYQRLVDSGAVSWADALRLQDEWQRAVMDTSHRYTATHGISGSRDPDGTMNHLAFRRTVAAEALASGDRQRINQAISELSSYMIQHFPRAGEMINEHLARQQADRPRGDSRLSAAVHPQDAGTVDNFAQRLRSGVQERPHDREHERDMLIARAAYLIRQDMRAANAAWRDTTFQRWEDRIHEARDLEGQREALQRLREHINRDYPEYSGELAAVLAPLGGDRPVEGPLHTATQLANVIQSGEPLEIRDSTGSYRRIVSAEQGPRNRYIFRTEGGDQLQFGADELVQWRDPSWGRGPDISPGARLYRAPLHEMIRQSAMHPDAVIELDVGGGDWRVVRRDNGTLTMDMRPGQNADLHLVDGTSFRVAAFDQDLDFRVTDQPAAGPTSEMLNTARRIAFIEGSDADTLRWAIEQYERQPNLPDAQRVLRQAIVDLGYEQWLAGMPDAGDGQGVPSVAVMEQMDDRDLRDLAMEFMLPRVPSLPLSAEQREDLIQRMGVLATPAPGVVPTRAATPPAMPQRAPTRRGRNEYNQAVIQAAYRWNQRLRNEYDGDDEDIDGSDSEIARLSEEYRYTQSDTEQDEIVDALREYVENEYGADVFSAVPAQGRSLPDWPAGATTLREALSELNQRGRSPDNDSEYLRRAEAMWNYEDPHSSLRAEVTGVSVFSGQMEIRGHIYQADGTDVGEFTRNLRADGSVSHSYFKIRGHDQGGGFSTRWLERMKQQYRDQGFDRITISANIDIGGYAWAKAGFDFASDHYGQMFLTNLMDDVTRGRHSVTPETAQEVRDLLDRANRGEHVTPLEIAMLGWRQRDREQYQVTSRPGTYYPIPAANGDLIEMWLGKYFMLGKSWSGRMDL